MPSHPTPGRSLVTRRALADIVRAATLGSYGVTGFVASPIERLAGWLGVAQPGLRLDVADDALTIELHLTVAYGLPVAEVARQVDSAVRYAVRRSVGRELDGIAIHIGALRYQPGPLPPAVPVGPIRQRADDALRPDDDLHAPDAEPVPAARDAT